MIHVIATIQVAPGRRQDFLREFHAIVPAVRAELGCQEYVPTIDVPTGAAAQIPTRDDVVTVIEKWTTREHLEKHLVAPHMIKYREKVKDLVLGVQLQILSPA